MADPFSAVGDRISIVGGDDGGNSGECGGADGFRETGNGIALRSWTDDRLSGRRRPRAGRGAGRGLLYGASTETPDALSVRLSLLRWRRRLVPAGAIAAIDDRTRVIGLLLERNALRAFV